LIAGGSEKFADFTELVKLFPGRVKHAVLIGETAPKIAESCKKAGFNDFSFEKDMKTAVHACREMARPGDCVLLSPACASYDMFDNFEHRGRVFKQIVEELNNGEH